MPFKYYVLTSGSLNALARQFETLKSSETVVVINTLDKGYSDEATGFCTSNDIEYHITESDGTPATGKNSVLKLFLESDNEYMVHVDGDEIITTYGRNLYRTVAYQETPPDVICLYNQICFRNYQDGLLDLFRKQVDSNTVAKKHMFIPPSYRPGFFHAIDTLSVRKYNPRVTESEVNRLVSDCDWLTQEDAQRWVENKIYLQDFAIRHSDRRNTLNRLVFFSRKAASMMKYNSNLVVGEDVVQCHLLKKLAYEGELDMQIRNESPKYTYLYVSNDYSITRKETPDWEWMEPLIKELNKMEPELPEFRLSEFKDPYYEVN
jgi:hypothetical protein